MIFDNRRISEITPQELIDLIGNQEENLWIDFKQQDYHRDSKDLEKHKREICKDITAMANAEGGYILIGVNEQNKIAQDFFTVSNAAKVVQSIKDICRQYTDPPILNLEVEQYPLQWRDKNIELVIIHIPPSERKPHGFQWKGTTNFVKRDADATRTYKVPELIQDLLVSYQPPIVGEINRQMGEINRQLSAITNHIQVDRRNSISAQDNALEYPMIENLLRLMELRFKEAISDQPYYRIVAVPKDLNPQAIDTRDSNIRQIMFNPPDRRYGNFGVTGILDREMSRSPEGISGPNITGGEIILLKNGFLEVRCPLSDTQFQWQRSEARISTPWLYPYVVCEFPVTFLRLVKTIYEAAGITSSVFVQQDYYNLKGFMLPRGNPSNIGFAAFQDERSVYKQRSPIISKRNIEPDFNPEHIAYDLVKDVYDCFGLDQKWIPAFDENGNFILT